jgi:hypothetical protein
MSEHVDHENWTLLIVDDDQAFRTR